MALIPDDDEETTKTLIEDDDEEEPAALAPTPRQRKRVSAATMQRIQEFANAPSRFTSAPKAEKAEKPLGVLGTIKEGAKSTARALGATIDTYQGDEAEVVEASKVQEAAKKDPRLASFLASIVDHKRRLGPDPSLWESLKAVGSAAIDNPAGAGLMVAEQIPNSIAALGAGGAGALAGSIAGPVGTVVGGLAGLAGANIGLETGHKALEAGATGSFSPEEQERVKGEGAIKGGVITGVDTLTLGATKFITGASRRAVESATKKTLADQGIDVADAAAVKAALADPAVLATVNEARKLAAQASSTLGKRIAQTGGALALETIGEGVGEYVGEFAATGKADMVDAVLESISSLSQSMGEIAYTSALNKRATNRLFDTPEDAEKAARKDTDKTGVKYEVKPHPVEPEKFVAVPKSRTGDGVEVTPDETGEIIPKAPDPSAPAPKRDETLAKNIEAFAKNPDIVPGIDNPTPAPTPTETINTIIDGPAPKATKPQKPVKVADVPKPAPAPVKPATVVETPKPVKPEAVKPVKAKAPEPVEPAVEPVKPVEVPKEPEQTTEDPEVRLLVDRLIKRTAYSDGHKKKPFSNAKKAAVAFLNGEDVLPARFGSAAAILAHDSVAVEILNDLQARAQAKKAAKPKQKATKEKVKAKPEETQAAPDTPQPVPDENNAGIVLPDGTDLPAKWDVVDADTVTASLKEGVNQPRDRSRAASDIQVQGIANNPDYRRLSHSPVMDIGAPTLSHDGLIVGGNGRFEGVSRAHDQGTAKDYLAQLKADAKAKGIDPARIDAMKKPVLVRRITKPFDTRKLAVASNSGTGMQYSAMEMAKIDAGRMKGLADIEVTDSGDIALTGSNRQSIRDALGDYNAAELGSMVDKHGTMSQEGVRRIRNAMLYAAYGSNSTLERLVESTDNDMRNISGALVKAAGSVAKARSDIEAGALPKELDISADLVKAVEELAKIRAQGMTVDEHLAQIGMFGDDMTEDEKQILRILGANIRSQKKIADFIRSYYDAVSHIDLTSGDMFGAKTPTKPELLEHAKERITEKQPAVKDLFARSPGTANSEGTKQPGDNGGAEASGQKDRVKSVVDSVKARWKNSPEVVVLNDMTEAPLSVRAENARQLSQGATGEPEGFISKGKVYLVASQLKTPGDVVRVLLHESLGHYGLRGTFGTSLETILKQVSALRRRDVEAKAKEYGLDMSKESDRLIAAEEILSEMAQANTQSGLVQRAFAAIRKWLRENVPGFENLSLSDAEIIETILIPARQFVQKGAAAPNGTTSFSRGTDAFKKWFGDSKIVDENRNPLVAYHGTNRKFTRFSKKVFPNFNTPQDKLGFFFTGGKDYAEQYGKNVMPVYLAISNPKIESLRKIDEIENGTRQSAGRYIAQLKREGYDGIIFGDVSNGEIVAFSPGQIKSATDNKGTFDGSNPDIRFSRSAAAPTSTPFRERMAGIADTLIYNFQDRFKPLKDIQERAGAVPEEQDAALAEERYSGTVRARTDAFEEQLRDPLLKAIHDSGVAYEDVEDFLHALHAPSRNAAMHEINPTADELKAKTDALTAERDSLASDPNVKEFLRLRKELRSAEADIEDGVADESLATMIRNEIAQLRKLDPVKDYANALDKLKGLRVIKPFTGDNTALSGMSNAESKAILDKIDANGTRKALDKISAIVDTITSKTRQIYAESGLEKADAMEAWDKKYEHYVPLHRDEVSGGTMPKTGQGFNIRGKESKRATGSNKQVTDILAHVVAQHEAAIVRSEKTRVDQTLFKFAQAHPDPELWTLDEAPMIPAIDDRTGLVVKRVDPTYKNKPEVLTLKIDGEEHTITFNDQNPEAMRLVTSMKNLSAGEMGEVTAMVGKFTRFLAQMNTTMNPVFTARNFLRDLQTAFVNLSDTAIAEKKKEVFSNVGSAIKGMWDLSKGKHGSKWAKYAEEFKAAGGQTGWMEHYKDIGARADTLRKELAVMGPGRLNSTRRTIKSLLDVIGDANGAVENGVRLSAYVSARKSGMTEGKAAQLAKNLTVNFNTHGARGIELNAWYMFMNASIQGTARLIKALSNRQVQKIVSGVVLSGFLLDILARSMAGDEDDDGENDYDQLPEHTKAMNFVFMLDGRPVTIPMPYGYNFFAATGRKVSEMMFRENYSAVKSAADLAGIFIDAFSPTGQAGSGLQYISPTVTDPLVQWAENKNFAGNPLRRPQTPFGVPNPEYQMGFKSTSAPAKWLAEILNDGTGGNEVRPGFVDVNPAFFDFAVSSIAGGAGRTLLQTISAPIKAGSDDEIQAREVPFLNIFVGAKPEHQTERKYFEAVKKVELAKKEIKTYREKGDHEMVQQIREDHAAELRLINAAKETKKVLERLRKRDLLLDKADPENKAALRKAIEEQKRITMSKFNKQYQAATAEP